MKHKIITLLFFFFTISTWGQSYEDFKKDFTSALDTNITTEKFKVTFNQYLEFFFPHMENEELESNPEEDEKSQFSLSSFKEDKLYTENIKSLLNSSNPAQRLLATMVITGSCAASFENHFLVSLREEKDTACLVWAGMALMFLKSNHTTAIFDFLVENENFTDAHMIPLLFNLNKDSLRQTAYSRINSDNILARILAVQLFSITGLNEKTDELLRKAVNEWDFNIKGFAIYSVSELQMGNLLPLLKPLLDSAKTRNISLEALANSPTDSDRQYLLNMVNEKDTVSEEVLDCLYNSKNIECTRIWLKMLYTNLIPKGYHFSVFTHPWIRSDSLLAEVQTALNKITDPEILSNLVNALRDRKDVLSVDIALSFLRHPDHSVRYWTAESLKGCTSPKLRNMLPELLKDPALRVTSLTTLVIENEIDTLQSIFETILKEESEYDWERSAIDYLSSFPLERNKGLFREILQKDNEDYFIKRDAAIGLAKLNDTASVDIIIASCRKFGEGSDHNAYSFLLALGILKGDKAKMEIEKFKDSDDESVRELVAEILAEW